MRVGRRLNSCYWMVKKMLQDDNELSERKSSDGIDFVSLFVTFFGCGRAKYAPGTFGTLAGASVFFVSFFFYLPFWWQIGILSVLCVVSVKLCNIYISNNLEADPPEVVIDEVLAIMLALCIAYNYTSNWIASLLFCLPVFRFLDIRKPLFIGWLDRNVHKGQGIMLDDIVAGLVTAALYCFCYRGFAML